MQMQSFNIYSVLLSWNSVYTCIYSHRRTFYVAVTHVGNKIMQMREKSPSMDNCFHIQCRLLTSFPFLRVSCETPASPTRVKLTHTPSRIHALFAKFFIWTNQKRVVPAQDSRPIILLIWPAIIYACQRRDILANKFTTNAVRGYWGHLVFRTVPVFLIS